jgi:uncharacterized repeat protein (TIGR03803 family)
LSSAGTNVLFGTTFKGGDSNDGTLFAINTDGSGLNNLYSFTAPSGPSSTNSDGAGPVAGLVQSGDTLYGDVKFGGTGGNGTVIKVNTDGSSFTVLHTFTPVSNGTNNDGSLAGGDLTLSGSTLYGTASGGGSSGNGTVFSINTDGTGFTVLHSFSGGGGSSPNGGLILSDNILYGTTSFNSNSGSGNGTIFSITLPSTQPQLTITPSGSNAILTWPTNANGFTLQSTTNLDSPVWTTNSVLPVIINGQYTVTNLISGTLLFYRLTR